jgi:hypothetical protein
MERVVKVRGGSVPASTCSADGDIRDMIVLPTTCIASLTELNINSL